MPLYAYARCTRVVFRGQARVGLEVVAAVHVQQAHQLQHRHQWHRYARHHRVHALQQGYASLIYQTDKLLCLKALIVWQTP